MRAPLLAAVAAVLLAAAPALPAAENAPLPSVESTASAAAAPSFHRIIAATPALTEIVYALGGEDRLVGIAKYSDYPPRAKKEKPQIGGILDVDYEKTLSLKPDLVLTPPGAMANEKLGRLGVPVKFIPNKTLGDITSSFVTVGEVVDRAAEGRAMAERFRAAITAARERHRATRPVSVLVVIGYEPLYVAGGYGFLNELIDAAGGANVMAKTERDFFAADVESVIAAKPEVIVDLTLEDTSAADRRAAVLSYWRRFSSIPAVADRRIEVIDSDFLTIPGPRLVDGLAALEKALHGAEPADGGGGAR